MQAVQKDDPWAGLLDEDETIAWQGRPDAGRPWALVSPADLLLGGLFACMGVRFLIDGLASDESVAQLFGVLFALIGLIVILRDVLPTVWRRRRTVYALTDKRALVVINTFFSGRQLRSCPIEPDMMIELKDGTWPSVFFGPVAAGKGQRQVTNKVGFEGIADARLVMRLMRATQSNIADRMS